MLLASIALELHTVVDGSEIIRTLSTLIQTKYRILKTVLQ